MDKFQILEEFKRKIMSRITYTKETPQGIENMIENAFIGLLNEYKNLQCDTASIEEYIIGNIEFTRNEIARNLGSARKENELVYIQTFLSRLQWELTDENLKKSDEVHREEIRQMEPASHEMAIKIMNTLDNTLKNVQLAQARRLSANGYSQDRIDSIQEQVKYYISKFINRNGKVVEEMLSKDADDLKAYLLETYEQYVEQQRLLGNEEVSQKSQRQEFLEGLDANIGLQEQNDFAKKIVSENENERNKEPLPDNIIDF